MKKIAYIFIRLSGLAFLLLSWQIAYSLNIFEPTLFPSPTKIVFASVSLFAHNNLLKEILFSLQRVFAGFSMATILGVLFGLAIGLNKYLYKSFEGLVDFFRSIPVVTLYPIFVLLFGIHDSAKIAMTFWATFWVITLNTAYGVKQSNYVRKNVAKIYGANKIQSFKWITFYEALPQTLVGVRIGLSFALLAEIMCEMFMGSNHGIGQKIYEANIKLSASELYALVVITGVLGIIINRMFALIERKMLPWVIEL